MQNESINYVNPQNKIYQKNYFIPIKNVQHFWLRFPYQC